ncbi:MAG: hypothetical protein U0R24_04000 [Solirubrobacterales bacterium]
MIAGGPGTGKTTTVARIAALLMADAERGGRVPLIAGGADGQARSGCRSQCAMRPRGWT